MTDWPPDGYRDPQQWERSEKGVAIIFLITGGILIPFVWADLTILVNRISDGILLLGEVLHLSGSAIGMLTVTGMVTAVVTGLLGLFFLKVVTPFHEWIHYKIDERLGLNPEYTYQEHLFWKNPAVVPVTTGITLTENTFVALGPIIGISIIAGGVMSIANGVLAGLAAFVLLANAASSAGDLYNVWRFAWMPTGTLFANFKDGEDEFRTEYAIPEAI